MARRSPHSVWMLAAAWLMTGCALKHPIASFKQTIGQEPTLELQGTVVPGANADSVIPFDLVVVRDKTMLKQIGKMNAAAWFSNKGRCTYRSGPNGKVVFYSWEFVPGQSFTVRIPVPADTNAVFGFANYQSAAPHRIELPNSGTDKVLLDRDGVKLIGKSDNHDSDALAAEQQKVCPDD